MKLVKLFLAVMAMLNFGALSAQTVKFGHVNSQAILELMPEQKSVNDQLEAEYTRLEAQLTDLQEALQTKQRNYVDNAETMTSAERATVEQDLQETNQKVQNFYQNSQQQLKEKEQTLRAPVYDKLIKAIETVGEENGFTYIFEEMSGLAVYKSENSIDVTDLVKTKLGISL